MQVERYIDMIRDGVAPLPLVLSRADIAKVVSARFGLSLRYEDLPAFAERNFLYFTPEKDTSIGVEEIRRLIPQLYFETGWEIRLVVIDRFDIATDQTANALLKILEDGIPGVVFLLQATTFVGLLDTIVSRVVCVSSDMNQLVVRDADRDFVKNILAGNMEALKKYVDAKWTNRSDALIFVEAIEQVLRDRSIGWNIYELLSETYCTIANTNAQSKFILDRVFLELVKQGRN